MKFLDWLTLVYLIVANGTQHTEQLNGSNVLENQIHEPRASVIKTTRLTGPSRQQPPYHRKPMKSVRKPSRPQSPWFKSDHYHQQPYNPPASYDQPSVHYSGGGYHHAPMQHYSKHKELGYLKPLLLLLAVPLGILLALGSILSLARSNSTQGFVGQQQQQQVIIIINMIHIT